MNPRMNLVVPALLAACSSIAAAQSNNTNVTLYGVVDGYLEYNSGGNNSRFAVQSGGMSGSRWGLRGSEDLGGGIKANFQIESGFAVDQGVITQGGTFFGRQAWAGVSGGFGSVSLGRQYTPHFILADSLDAFETGYASPFSTGVVTTISRLNNSVAYNSPSFGGVNGSLIYSFGEKAGKTSSATMSGAVTYSGGPLFAGVSHLRDKDNVVTNVRTDATLLGAAVKLGLARISGGYGRVKSENILTNAETTRDEFFLGSQFALTASDQVWIEIAQGETDEINNSKAQSVSLGYTHSLSKRTNVYAMFSYNRNEAQAQTGPSGASSVGDYSFNAGQDPKGLALGFRHRF